MATDFDSNAVYVQDTRLSNFSKFQGNELMQDFVALWAAEPFNVDSPKFEYNVWGRQHQMFIGNTLRGEGEEGAVVRFGFSQAAGSADEYAIRAEIPRERSQFAETSLRVLESISRFLEELKLIDIEMRFKDAVDDTATHNGGTNAETLSGTSQWSDYTNSDPIGDIEDGREAIRTACGHYPNKMWFSPKVFKILRNHPSVLNAIKYTGVTKASLAQLAEIFEVQEVRIAKGRYISSVYGETVVGADIWGKDLFMAYSAPNPGLMDLTYGWHASRPLAGYPGLREVVESKYDDSKVMDKKRVRYSYKFNDVSMADGTTYYFKNAVA